ncbi:hypothetical protein ABKV19_019988 [Rosa sericea]
MILDKGSMQSNLECFLHGTTPVLQPQFLPKSEIRNLNRLWHPWEREKVEYFTLSDLWNCFDEWSAYGAGDVGPMVVVGDPDGQSDGLDWGRVRGKVRELGEGGLTHVEEVGGFAGKLDLSNGGGGGMMGLAGGGGEGEEESKGEEGEEDEGGHGDEDE